MKTMSKTMTLREANQAFSRCIREVEAGEEITITRRGQAVARLVPAGRKRVLAPDQEAAVARLKAAMKEGWPLNAGRFNRDELYDEILGIHDPKRRR
jgi:prevent-host-death family protein